MEENYYDELIKACIKAISGYNPNIETPDSFVDKFLQNVILLFIFIICR